MLYKSYRDLYPISCMDKSSLEYILAHKSVFKVTPQAKENTDVINWYKSSQYYNKWTTERELLVFKWYIIRWAILLGWQNVWKEEAWISLVNSFDNMLFKDYEKLLNWLTEDEINKRFKKYSSLMADFNQFTTEELGIVLSTWNLETKELIYDALLSLNLTPYFRFCIIWQNELADRIGNLLVNNN